MLKFGAFRLRIYLATASMLVVTAFWTNYELKLIEFRSFDFSGFALALAFSAAPLALYVAFVRGRAVSVGTGFLLLAIVVYTVWGVAASKESSQQAFTLVHGLWLQTLVVLVISALELAVRLVKRVLPSTKERQAL